MDFIWKIMSDMRNKYIENTLSPLLGYGTTFIKHMIDVT